HLHTLHALLPLLLIQLPPPPSTTLFPYTTLFRSSRPQRPHPIIAQLTGGATYFSSSESSGLFSSGFLSSAFSSTPPIIIMKVLRDRKSTRLNSSHRTISYAVFCLKKKKYKYI